MGYHAIALQSEMQLPNEKLIFELKNRFDKIDVLYDNDFNNINNPGQTMAKKICELHGLKNLCLPNKYKCKDISDLIKSVGIDVTYTLLKNLINEKI